MTMKLAPELSDWAKGEAQRLRDMAGTNRHELDSVPSSVIHAQGAPAIEFLRRYAPESEFLRAAENCFSMDSRQTADAACERVAEILDLWSQFVQKGLAEALPFPAQARIEAATDLMEQVQQLLDDKIAHPAAPVVLAGAALEEFLRSRIHARGIAVSGKPGINTYAQLLRTDGDLSPQDVKDITSWAGQRNDAAHGDFANLSRERAQIMVDGINLFMRQKS